VAARGKQHDAACAAQGRTTDDYWARRAKSYSRFAGESQSEDPFVERLLRRFGTEDTVLDVGAGTGRHAVPLARHVRRVIAVDPSAAMLRFLRQGATEAGLDNVDIFEGAWPDIERDVPAADVAISAHVLYPIEDVAPFLVALDGHARRTCFLHLMARQPWFDEMGLWEAVHGDQRLPQPTYIDVVNLLHQLGAYANVAIDWVETPRRYASLDEAVEVFAETVAAGEDAARLERLRNALSRRLESAEDGRLSLPLDSYPLATVWWEAGVLRGGQV
jgi:SAM-dependent methyltransferase